MEKELVRNPYNYDSDKLSNDTGLKCQDPSLTEQEHVEEADINYVADRFMRTGQLPQVLHLPTQGDFEGVFDFQTAMNTIARAKIEFASLPAKIRTRFANDPAQLLAFVQDEENRDEAIKLGFLPKPDTIPAAVQPKEKTDDTRSASRTEDRQDREEGAPGAQGTKGKDAGTKKP